MSENYIRFFEDINDTLSKAFKRMSPIEVKILGFTALCLNGLPDRGTKDLDMLEIDTVHDATLAKVVPFLLEEFGKKSPGLYRHGMYLDFVPKGLVCLPPKPRYDPYKNLDYLRISLLDPTDVCVTKVFSYFKSSVRRHNDRQDIHSALNKGLVTCDRFIRRLEEALPLHELHADAPEIYKKIIAFIQDDIIQSYGNSKTVLRYEIPSWMENIQA